MRAVLMVLAMALGGSAMATPGTVDARGCHNSKKIGHHCHPERASAQAGSGSGESTAERERRLKRECKGKRNGGMCLGYGSFE